MSIFPDCRTDDVYNEKYLDARDAAFLQGFDYCVQTIKSLFENVETYPDLEILLDDKKAVIMEDKAMIVSDAVEDWAEMERNVLITSMIDSMGGEEYAAIKAEVNK